MSGVIVSIDGNACIGCTKCIAACPTDAIVGAKRHEHVVVDAFCIGCKKCIPPCPVACIAIVPYDNTQTPRNRAQMAKQRIQRRKIRLANQSKQTESLNTTTQVDMASLMARLNQR